MHRKSLELYYPSSFLFFLIKLYKSDKDFRDISSKILLLFSSLHDSFFPRGIFFSIWGQKYFPTFHPRQLPLRKLTLFTSRIIYPRIRYPTLSRSIRQKISFFDRACPFIKKKKRRIKGFLMSTKSTYFFFSLSSSSATRTLKKVTYTRTRNEDEREKKRRTNGVSLSRVSFGQKYITSSKGAIRWSDGPITREIGNEGKV